MKTSRQGDLKTIDNRSPWSHVTPNHHFGARLWSTSGTRLLAACPPTAATSCVLYHARSTARLSRRILIASPTAGSPEQHRFIFSQLVRTRVDEEETRSNRAQRAATHTNVASLNRIAHRTRPAVATDVLWAIDTVDAQCATAGEDDVRRRILRVFASIRAVQSTGRWSGTH